MTRVFTRLAVVGLVLAVLSSTCVQCLAAVGEALPLPAQGTAGNCHPEDPGTHEDAGCCKCPIVIPADYPDQNAAIVPAHAGTGDDAALHAKAPIAPRRVQLAGILLPDNLPVVPRLSPIRSFCIRLE